MLDNIKLRTKLLAGNGLVLSLLLIISVIVLIAINSLFGNFKWVNHTHKVLAKASAIEAAAVDMETGMRGYLLAGKEDFLEPYNSGKQRFGRLIDELSETVSDNPPQVELLAETRKTIEQWQQEITEPYIALRRNVGDTKTMDDIATMVGEARGKVFFDNFRGQLATFKGKEAALMEQRITALDSTSTMVINTTVFGTLITIILGLAVALFLTKHIMRQLGGEPNYIAKNVAEGDLNTTISSDQPMEGVFAELHNMVESLQEKAQVAKRIADGDLTTKVHLASGRDILGQALFGMVENLNNLLRQIQTSSYSITDSSRKLSDTSQSVAEGSSQQATSLESISASLLELTSQTNENAENAKEARQLTSTAQSAAEKGSQQMSSMMQAMEEINSSGQNIETFIKTIDEIAAQTNLLALNAAIEAARAGEQGRGFAVFADEVRSLAARSAAAAQETSELISRSAEKTENGISIATQTTESLENIFSNVAKA